MARSRLKILFVARHFTYFRNYESVVTALAERGHQLHLAAERDEYLGGRAMVERLAAQHPSAISFGWIPERDDSWGPFLTKLRMTLDYLRYLEAEYASTPRLRARARQRVPRVGLWLLTAGAWSRAGRIVLQRLLRACERAVPRSRQIDAYLSDHQPDVVLFTPLIGVVVSPQLDYLRSARALGLRTALCVWSWDHLSSKAILRDIPDRVFVWNETQRTEAVTLHQVRAEQVVVTGAQCFDHWFDRQPSMDRRTFCASVGLPDRPFLLYVCSALFRGSVDEAQFVRHWIQELRRSGLHPLASTPILVRPHPARLKEWTDIDLSSEHDAVLWGRNPIDADARDGYFNSLFHSAAVVGLNTSAFLEAAIVNRPVFATLLPEHHENQEGTIHFHYLLTVEGGLLHTSRTLHDHFAQLNAALDHPDHVSARSRRFVEAFIRPHGIDVAATPRFAREVEELGAKHGIAPLDETQGSTLLRLALSPVAALARAEAMAPFVLSAHERKLAARDRVHRLQVAEAWRVKDAQKAAEQSRKDRRLAARQRYKARRAAEWRRTKTMNNLKRRIKKRIGFAG
jgi:hypothetical protein